MRVEGREDGKAVGVPSSRLAPEAVNQNRRDTPVVGKGMARQELPDELAASRSTAVLPPAAIIENSISNGYAASTETERACVP